MEHEREATELSDGSTGLENEKWKTKKTAFWSWSKRQQRLHWWIIKNRLNEIRLKSSRFFFLSTRCSFNRSRAARVCGGRLHAWNRKFHTLEQKVIAGSIQGIISLLSIILIMLPSRFCVRLIGLQCYTILHSHVQWWDNDFWRWSTIDDSFYFPLECFKCRMGAVRCDV